NREEPAIESYGPAGDGGVSAEFALPERVADHRAGRSAAGLIVLRREGSTNRRRNSEDLEEIAADEQAFSESHFSTFRKIEARGAPTHRSRKALLPGANALPERVSEARAAGGRPSHPPGSFGHI